MAVPTQLFTTVHVCEDTDQSFSLVQLLTQAGYVPTGDASILTLSIRNADGSYSSTSPLVSLTPDKRGLLVTGTGIADWNGSVSTLSLVFEQGGLSYNIDVQIIIDPVNDAPEGADLDIALATGSAYVLKEADFGFTDVKDGNGFKSVFISSLPESGQLRLNGVALAAGAEVSITDIRAGRLTYVPASNGSGEVSFGFQVRDDGGLVGCNAADLDATPNYITFELPRTASLGDRVWFDTNRNGVQDTGEAGAAGVLVTLKGAGADGMLGTADDTTATTTTNASGNYAFTGLSAGMYQVVFGGMAGYSFTTANAGGNDATDSDASASGVSHVIALALGQSNQTIDAGLVLNDTLTARLGDRLWIDADRDGIQDSGEVGMSGVTVTLAGAGADGVFGTADDISRTTTTNGTGNYLFSNLAAGQYRVSFGTVTGYDFTTANVGSNDGVDSDVNANGVSHVVTLGIGQSDLTVDAGIVQRPQGTGKIGNFVWFDYGSGSSYHNGLQDSNETTAPYLVVNVKVTLHDAGSGAVLQTTYTGADGKYLFTGVDAGNYYLTFDKSNAVYYSAYYGRYETVARQAWVQKDVGTDDTRDSDVSGLMRTEQELRVSRTDSFYLAQGQVDLTRDAGITPIVLDLDGNGIQTVARSASDATFDLFGNGSPVKSGWISGGDGFLAVDSNGNGRIDDIGELFGGNAKGAGFAKLASFDSNGDGLVDARDSAFGELRVWVDADGNRQTDAGELRTLAEAGISALKADYVEQPFLDAQGNLHLERSSATLADGSMVDMTDVYFNVDAADAQAAGVELPTMAELLGTGNTLMDAAFGACAPQAVDATPGAVSGELGDIYRSLLSAMKHIDTATAMAA